MSIRKQFLAVAFLVVCSLGVGAQDKEIKRAPARPTSAASGKEMFASYCAVCHGRDGKGGGPAAAALKVAPADLTVLSQKNGGKFPSLHVASVLGGEADLPAHGNKEMPVWGPVFWAMSQGNAGEVQQRIANLTKFVESLQAK
jgi:mono/diheme cytochrome c family protein